MSQHETPDPRDHVFDVSDAAHDLGRRTGRSAMTVIGFSGARLLSALGSTAILARMVPPDQQGIVAMSMPAVLIATGLSEFGLAQAIVQRPHVTHRLVSTLMWIGVALGLGLSTIVALLGGPAARFYGTPEVAAVFLWTAPYVFLSVLTAQYVAILRRQMRIAQIEIGSLGSTILASLLAIGVAIAGGGYWALTVQLVMAELFNLIYLIYRARWLPSSPLACRLSDARSAVNFGVFLAAERLLGEFSRDMQVIVIGRMFTQVDAGLFYRAQTAAQMPARRIVSPLSGAFIPALSRLQNSPDAFRAMYMRQVSRSNLIMVPIGLIFLSCADALVRILLGPDWGAAAPILAWLGLLPIGHLTLSSLSWVLVACGHSRALLLFRVVGTALLVGAMLVGARYGVVPLVASYALTLIFLQGPLLAATAIRYTPITLATLRETLLGEFIFAVVTGAVLVGLRYVMDFASIWPEVAVVLLALMLIYGLRIWFTPSLRSDVGKVLRIRR